MSKFYIKHNLGINGKNWKKIKRRLIERDGRPGQEKGQININCFLCNRGLTGSPYFTIHHIFGIDEGNRVDLDNMVILCTKCHREVHLSNWTRDLLLKRLKRKGIIKDEMDIWYSKGALESNEVIPNE